MTSTISTPLHARNAYRVFASENFGILEKVDLCSRFRGFVNCSPKVANSLRVLSQVISGHLDWTHLP